MFRKLIAAGVINAGLKGQLYLCLHLSISEVGVQRTGSPFIVW